ncbi:MAG: hypothetical protein JWQ09_5186, partial [Segetibacter sp.]|nr:hypothetical protein [Segetibacter sp.]
MGCSASAQTDTNNTLQADTEVLIRPSISPKPIKRRVVVDSLKRKRRLDTLMVADSTAKRDSFTFALSDTSHGLISADTAKIVAKPKI